MNVNIENYYTARKSIYERFNESNTITNIVFSFLMACITGLMAQIVIPLPWTPVPITAQTFAVLCSGLFLGKRYGCPWFGGMTGGLNVVLGSTGGYLIGFIIASYFIGYITEKYATARNFTRMFAVISIANFALIYIPGLAGLALWSSYAGAPLGIIDLLMMGLVPFIAGDIVKILGAASVSKAFLPKD